MLPGEDTVDLPFGNSLISNFLLFCSLALILLEKGGALIDAKSEGLWLLSQVIRSSLFLLEAKAVYGQVHLCSFMLALTPLSFNTHSQNGGHSQDPSWRGVQVLGITSKKLNETQKYSGGRAVY